MPHEPRFAHRTRAGRRPFDRQVDRMDGRCSDGLGRRLQPARSILGLGRRLDPGRSQQSSRRGDPLLCLRHAEGADAAHAGRVRHGRGAQLLLAGEDPGPARRKARRRRQRAGCVARYRHAVLLLLRRAVVHRLRQRGRAAWGDVFVPDRRADGERGGARAAVRAGRLESGADLSRLRPRRCHRLRLGHRPAASRALARGMGSQHALGRGRASSRKSFRLSTASGPASTP